MHAYSYLHIKLCFIMKYNILQICTYIACTTVRMCSPCPCLSQVLLWSWHTDTNDIWYLSITLALYSTQINFNCNSILHGTHESPSHCHNSFFYSSLNRKHRLLTLSCKTLHWSICYNHISQHLLILKLYKMYQIPHCSSTNRTYDHSNLQMQGINFIRI